MQIAEYYDSVAPIWDDDYAEAKAARIVTAMVSIHRGGACVMDVGCGSGAMFADLMDGGACEIEGVDISGEMIRLAQKKYGADPRIHLTQADFLQLEQPGYEVIVSFNAYHHFLQPRGFLKKARELLLPRGRLTVALQGSCSLRRRKPNSGGNSSRSTVSVITTRCFCFPARRNKTNHFSNFIPQGGLPHGREFCYALIRSDA